jgi:hypothetical protein
MTDYQLNNKQLFTVSIVSVVVTFITILACQVVYYTLRNEFQATVLERSEYRIGNEALAGQREEISTFGVDEETGRLEIPIRRAMQFVVEGSEKPAAQEEAKPDEA